MAQTRYYSATAQKTTLVGGVDLAATSLTVAALNGFPASYPYTIIVDRDTIDEEVMEVTGATGTVLTVTRGVDGVPAVAHVVGATVEHGTSARDFREADQHRGAAENVHGIRVGSAVVGTTDVQTLTNKTLDEPVLINPTLKGEVIDGGDAPDPGGEINVESDIDMNNYKIFNLADGVEDDHAVNKGQLDAAIDLVNGATVDAGTTTTGAPGTNASVVNSGSVNAAVFDFTIPRGDAGEKGADGESFTYDDFTPEQLEGLKGPKGDDGDPFTYDDFTPEELEGLTGPPGPPGEDGADGKGVQIKGTVDSSVDLPGSADDGDIYIALDTGDGWVYDADTSDWTNIGPIRGPEGPAGQDGANGADGADGKGWTGGSYSSGTGKVTFTSDDGLGFETGDLRGDPGPAVDLPAADAADKVLTSTGTGVGDYEWADAAGGIDLTSEREAQLIQGDGSGGWATGMALKVVQDLPADDDPNYAVGDAVLVLGDVDPKGELPGIGGWADVSNVNGTGTKYEYTADGMDWSAFAWTADGSVTTSGGLLDALIVGGGAGTSGDGSIRGSGGGVITGVEQVETGELSVVVGAGGDNSGSSTSGMGKYSQLGLMRIGGGTRIDSPNGYKRGSSGGYYAGAGSAGDGQGRTTGGIGVTSSLINGTDVMYASGGGDYRAPADDRPGDGADGDNQASGGYAVAGEAGIVAIRVPRGNDKTGLAAGPFDTTTLRDKAAAAVKQVVKDRKVKK